MTPEQKQRAVDLIDVTKTYRLDAEECAMQMAAMLQELVDAPEVEPVAWKSLNDVQWMNIVNHNNAYWGCTKDEAVHEAVKMTEAKLKELNSETMPAPIVPGGWRSAIAKEFPLYDEDGLDEGKHCCEWVMLQERKRLHKILAAAMNEKGGA